MESDPIEAVALFDFQGQRDEECGFVEGETLYVVKADPSKKWWLVQSADKSRQGYAPYNFLAFPELLMDEVLDAQRGGGGDVESDDSRDLDGQSTALDSDGIARVSSVSILSDSSLGDDTASESEVQLRTWNTVSSSEDPDATPTATPSGEDARDAASPSASEGSASAGMRSSFDSRCSSASITSSQCIESLLEHKRRSGVISQEEYTLIMETRRVARELMEADGMGEFDDDSADDGVMLSPEKEAERGMAFAESTVSPPVPTSIVDKGKSAATSTARRPSLFSKLLGTADTTTATTTKRPSIEVLHPWTAAGSEGSIAPPPEDTKLVSLSSARSSMRNSLAGESEGTASIETDGAGAAEVVSTATPTTPTTSAAAAAGEAKPRTSVLRNSEVNFNDVHVEEWKACAEKRWMIVSEILTTERSYVAVLRMLLDVFAIPLRQAAELPPDKVRPGLLSSAAVEFTKAGIPKVAITRAQARVIFHELDSLAAINQLLLEQLEERCSKANWSSSATVGDIFLSIMSFLKGYTAFANNFNNALATITECKKQPSFTAYLHYCIEKKKECSNLWLDDHLIAPIQRIPRYIMLLSTLHDKTPVSHPDFELLSQCVLSMRAIARHINETKKKSEGAHKIIEVQQTVKRCPMIVSPARSFVFEMTGCTEMTVLNHARAKGIVDGDGSMDNCRVSAIGGSGGDATHRQSYIGSPVESHQSAASPVQARSSLPAVAESVSPMPPTAATTVASDTAATIIPKGSADLEHTAEATDTTDISGVSTVVTSAETSISLTGDTAPIDSHATSNESLANSVAVDLPQDCADIDVGGVDTTSMASGDGESAVVPSPVEVWASEVQSSIGGSPDSPLLADDAPTRPNRESLTAKIMQELRKDPDPIPIPSAHVGRAQSLKVTTRASSADPCLITSTDRASSVEVRPASDDTAVRPRTGSTTSPLGGGLPPTAPPNTADKLFFSNVNVAMYLFNDALLIASHVKINDVIGKAYESIKIMNRGFLGTKNAPVRPTTTCTNTGEDVIHKFKFQRIDSLDVISVSDFPDSDLLKHGFVIHFPEGPMYYRAETAEIKKQFFAAFQQACVLHGDLVDQQIETLQRAYTSTEA